MSPDWKPLKHLRVTEADIAVYPPDATYGPRRLRDYEFVWIIEGDAVANYDGQEIAAPSGTILLARPGMIDRYDWARKRRTVHAFFHFNFELPATGWPPCEKWPLAVQTPVNDVLRPLFRYVLGLHPLSEPLRTSLLEPCVNLMLRAFVSGKLTTAPEPYAELPPAVDKAIGIIRDRVFQDATRSITLTELAESVHVTKEHLCRLFRRNLNHGPLECVGLARVERAAFLLGRSNLTVKEVANTAGFKTPYHFSSKFKKVYGLSPRDYRNAVRVGAPVRVNPIVRLLRMEAPTKSSGRSG
jgi:AraC-like DNA-binding protein